MKSHKYIYSTCKNNFKNSYKTNEYPGKLQQNQTPPIGRMSDDRLLSGKVESLIKAVSQMWTLDA